VSASGILSAIQFINSIQLAFSTNQGNDSVASASIFLFHTQSIYTTNLSLVSILPVYALNQVISTVGLCILGNTQAQLLVHTCVAVHNHISTTFQVALVQNILQAVHLIILLSISST
jgi:hypothetical protein